MATHGIAVSAVGRRLVIPIVLAVAAMAALTTATASAASGSPDPGGGSDYWSVTGDPNGGAPGEQEVSIYCGSHEHLGIEQQLYGSRLVSVPHVDTTVHQSR
jgi:hypothetical protein